MNAQSDPSLSCAHYMTTITWLWVFLAGSCKGGFWVFRPPVLCSAKLSKELPSLGGAASAGGHTSYSLAEVLEGLQLQLFQPEVPQAQFPPQRSTSRQRGKKTALVARSSSRRFTERFRGVQLYRFTSSFSRSRSTVGAGDK